MLWRGNDWKPIDNPRLLDDPAEVERLYEKARRVVDPSQWRWMDKDTQLLATYVSDALSEAYMNYLLYLT